MRQDGKWHPMDDYEPGPWAPLDMPIDPDVFFWGMISTVVLIVLVVLAMVFLP
jgi:hypothetical protein